MGIGFRIALGGLGEGISRAGGHLAEAQRYEHERRKEEQRQRDVDRRLDMQEERDRTTATLAVNRAGGVVGNLDPRYYNEDGTVKSGNGNGSVGQVVGASTDSTQPSEYAPRPMRRAGRHGTQDVWLPTDGRTPEDVERDEDRDAARAQARQIADDNRRSREEQAEQNRQTREEIALLRRSASGMTPLQQQRERRATRAESLRNTQADRVEARTQANALDVPRRRDYEGWDSSSNDWATTNDSTGYNRDTRNYRRTMGDLRHKGAMAGYSADSTIAAGRHEDRNPGVVADEDPEFIVDQARRRLSTAKVLYNQARREAGNDPELLSAAAEAYNEVKQSTFDGVPPQLWARIQKW